ncbi:hypothetical protein Pflav_000490 [Phytohabitans flavus]|uniref:Uncharacterized protein n=1 Tax=Phytohabitans flavus TaxID=1076124 RepID=A0A6F8XIK9_9ACTN|nr:hypothetical protein Pflav_000490 [Phytohabitans flavus]
MSRRRGSIPFPSLRPETLALKLAELAQYLALWDGGHAVTQAQVREFLEQVVVQLQDFPQPPWTIDGRTSS